MSVQYEFYKYYFRYILYREIIKKILQCYFDDIGKCLKNYWKQYNFFQIMYKHIPSVKIFTNCLLHATFGSIQKCHRI